MDLDVASLRRHYRGDGLHVRDLDPDAMRQVAAWLADAHRAGQIEPNAAALATADAEGRPSVRMVLVKGLDAAGATFYTNYGSRKGRELEANPRAALCLWWDRLERQVRLEGPVSRTSREESEAYFRSRPRASRLAAWASEQSAPLPEREALEARLEEFRVRHEGEEVPLPPVWGGYTLEAEAVEVWQGRPDRLHDRFVYRRDGEVWTLARLYP